MAVQGIGRIGEMLMSAIGSPGKDAGGNICAVKDILVHICLLTLVRICSGVASLTSFRRQTRQDTN